MTLRNLYFLVTREHAYTINHHLETWGRSLRSFVRPVFYDELPRYRSLRPGTYVFSDLERLSDPQMRLATLVWETLEQSGAPVQLVNDPRKVLRREALLRTLHAAGINPFAVYRAGDDLSGAKYPLFVRRDNEHDGSLSALVHSAAELPAALAAARERGISNADLLLVEHCDTADAAGIYRKYAAFKINGRVFPYHIDFGKNWVVKRKEFFTPELEAEEAAFRASDQYAEQIGQVFALANVDYGRMDFALHNGRIVVWEINTNPTLGGDPFRAKPHRLPMIHAMVADVNAGLAALRPPADAPPAAPIPLRVPRSLLRRLGVGPGTLLARQARGALAQIAKSAPWQRAT